MSLLLLHETVFAAVAAAAVAVSIAVAFAVRKGASGGAT